MYIYIYELYNYVQVFFWRCGLLELAVFRAVEATGMPELVEKVFERGTLEHPGERLGVLGVRFECWN